jgi:hypothetical protein
MLNERVGAYQQAYQRDFQQYSDYATDTGLDPVMVVGKPADSAYAPKENQSTQPSTAPEVTATGPGGQKLVLREGQWVPLGQ